MSLTYFILLIILAPVPLLIWLPYLWSYSTALLSSIVLPSPQTEYEVGLGLGLGLGVFSGDQQL